MSEPSTSKPAAYQPKTPEHLAAGVYANAMATSHTPEEFVLDFIATYAAPSRLVARVIISPGHAKRLARTLQDNLTLYEKNFGPLPAEPKAEPTTPGQVQDLYAKLAIPETVLAGRYANNAVIRHSREEFILDFLTAFHPSPILNARVLVSPAHIRRIAKVLTARLRAYEESFGDLKESSGPADAQEPPPRFSLS